MVKVIEANFCFCIFGENSKIQNDRHFWGEEIFFKIAKSTLLRYPVGQKFRPILHGLGDRHIYVFAMYLLLRRLKLIPSTTIPRKQLTL